MQRTFPEAGKMIAKEAEMFPEAGKTFPGNCKLSITEESEGN